jgi:predicted phage gp36 major capsid-like protein
LYQLLFCIISIAQEGDFVNPLPALFSEVKAEERGQSDKLDAVPQKLHHAGMVLGDLRDKADSAPGGKNHGAGKNVSSHNYQFLSYFL